jgi:hypothetical protein
LGASIAVSCRVSAPNGADARDCHHIDGQTAPVAGVAPLSRRVVSRKLYRRCISGRVSPS